MITGSAALALENAPQSNPVRKHIEEIKSASLRATGIVKQLLCFSRKTNHQQDENLKIINLITVIKDALSFLRSTIPSTIEIKTIIPDADIWILGDPIQVNQILMNLCTNASQAMQKVGEIIEIGVETVTLNKQETGEYASLPAGQYIKIMIRNSGPGIAAENMNQIFDPYFTTKDVGEGTGLGLSVVHGIVKKHSGAIMVDSKPEIGSTFTFFPSDGRNTCG
ncbi:MAG: hypothetical protein GY699_02150 [Desulfobacteraceae bacterium]|nr:hypothetical protein [Desulfobacteraceae bacterium]